MAKLSAYRAKRDPAATPEPFGARRRRPKQKGPRFVVQEHHARSLHWDLRLERDGVLVSWAVPKGLPMDPRTNHLAVHTEDHPLDYYDFEGDIPEGEYGGGHVDLWDQGTYELEKWRDDEVMFTLHGRRVEGKYVLFRTRGKDWMIHRMDPPPPGWEPLPETLKPMFATPTAVLPKDDGRWGYEFKWDGVRALAFVEGGRLKLLSRNVLDVTKTYPELRGLGEAVGARPMLLDGEIVAFDANGRPDFGTLQARMRVESEARIRTLMRDVPVVYLLFDVLHLDGHSTMSLPYAERRDLLDALELDGPHWKTPPWFRGGGAAVLQASRDQGLEGVVAKRLDSPYLPGKRADFWRKVKNVRRQEVVVGGWTRGEGNREGRIGSLLVGVYDEPGGRLVYAGNVGTGFDDRSLKEVERLLKPLARKDSPFGTPVPNSHAKTATWVEPTLVAEVEFTEWTRDGKLRHPSYKGLRDDKDPREVVREVTA